MRNLEETTRHNRASESIDSTRAYASVLSGLAQQSQAATSQFQAEENVRHNKRSEFFTGVSNVIDAGNALINAYKSTTDRINARTNKFKAQTERSRTEVQNKRDTVKTGIGVITAGRDLAKSIIPLIP